MADKVADVRKHRIHRLADTGAHIVDTGDRISVIALDVPEKRDDPFGLFTGQLDVGQHQATQSVNAGHQCRGIILMESIQMQDIATRKGHGLFDARCCPAMGQCQV